MKMKKFINDPKNLRQELLEGLALANPQLVELTDNGLIVSKSLSSADRVTVVSLGGTGHEPALSGFVGEGILDVSVPGNIFAAPTPQLCLSALKQADRGHGSLLVVLNHPGDMLTGNMAMKLARQAGLRVVMLVTQEDISSAPRSRADERRGLMGCVPLYKIAGAAAASGRDLDEVAAISHRFADNMAAIAVATSGATHPVTGETLSVYGESEMEIGTGQHGEGGSGSQPMKTADETAAIMAQALIDDLSLTEGERVMLVINGSGSTTHMELLILFRAAYKYLESRGISIVAGMADEILTVQETAGFQMFVARMDDETLSLWNAPCRSPYLSK